MKCVELIFALREKERKIEVTREHTTTIDNLILVDWLKKKKKIYWYPERDREKKRHRAICNKLDFIRCRRHKSTWCMSVVDNAATFILQWTKNNQKRSVGKPKNWVSLLLKIIFIYKTKRQHECIHHMPLIRYNELLRHVVMNTIVLADKWPFLFI